LPRAPRAEPDKENAMSIAHTVRMFLEEQRIPYDLVAHKSTATSLRSAEQAHIEADRLAKAVLLEDDLEHAHYLLAVLPANRRLQLPELALAAGRRVHLASEEDAAGLFEDCTVGAIPPIGAAYGIETLVDDNVLGMPDVYFEAGDHEHLVHIRAQNFAKLFAESARGRFSEPH
jgi:Ala-tRNA(Pro) deacylase